MALPKVLKSPYTMGAAAAVGGGVFAANALGEEGENSMDDASDPHLPIPISHQENSCFRSLFPKLTSSSKEIKEEVVEEGQEKKEETVETSKYTPQKIAFPGLGESEQLKGCMGMRLSHDLNPSPTPFWAFNMGTAARGDKAGFVLYVDGVGGMAQTEEISYGQTMKYSLLLLEKGENETWSVKGGYSWKDGGIAGSDLKLFVSDLTGNNLLDAKGGAQSQGGSSFSGTWTSDSSSDAEPMFGKMEVKGLKGDSPLVVGRKGSFKGAVAGLKISLSDVYNPETGMWIQHKDPEFDLGEVLDAWYVPFISKAGKWEEQAEEASPEDSDEAEVELEEEEVDEDEYEEDGEEYEDEEGEDEEETEEDEGDDE